MAWSRWLPCRVESKLWNESCTRPVRVQSRLNDEVDSKSSQFAHPEAGRPDAVAVARREEAALFRGHVAIAVLPLRESVFECTAGSALHVAASPQHFELGIAHQQRLQQILLGPEGEVVQDRLARLIGEVAKFVGVGRQRAGG